MDLSAESAFARNEWIEALDLVLRCRQPERVSHVVQTQRGGIVADSIFTQDGRKTLHLQLDSIALPKFAKGALNFCAEGSLFLRTCSQLGILVKVELGLKHCLTKVVYLMDFRFSNFGRKSRPVMLS